ncbi:MULTISPECIES: L,D-transpeptidase family protein [Streptomyces]|uniref:L,D-transpeptidase family protein n=1 Tax=Streptomyces TaxID=1883 RepID=UPI0003A879CA|nr:MULTISPECIES: L,D-transpeptidase family protein [Streptomyces]MBZ6110248.1 L,D-transpeptidase family protein [Streptomyces olivaceus]MBZ6124845.1 L,D-transpeptidase family protein [Streptomyces olivaceus]MBZ6144953.1 L,D-transpeptidase family protein [Streptomyces olivaceus]MBZ6158933.1 L,D-transpeptidase family protein [Streptomyces olivaceus]MBZ6187055.1 L,D-transpeptidase family protein [Streptomyces olivaceus]
MRPGAVAALVSASLLLVGAVPARGSAPRPLPDRMADTGGSTQLITAVAPDTGATTGTLTWWDREGGADGRWVRAGSAPARFGAAGLADGATRAQGTNTTPTGLYDLPYAFGVEAAPPGTAYRYRPVREDSWWCQDNASRSYNRWTEPRPADCRAAEAEHLITYAEQYAHALVVGFNYDRPVHGRGAGIFLHVNGRGATAGCVSVPAEAMRRVLRWADPRERPHIVVGTSGGATAVTRY